MTTLRRPPPHLLPCLLASLAAAAASLSSCAAGHTPPSTPAGVTAPGGVVTTGQRIAPAGIQAVFEGRVEGLAFGTGDELLVLIRSSGADPSGVWRLAWQQNRLLGHADLICPFGGSAGLQSIRVDPVDGTPLVTYVGPLPDAPSPAGGRRPVGVLLGVVRGDTLASLSGGLGQREVGATAVARGPSPDGRRRVAVPLTFDNRLAVLDRASGQLLGSAPTGIAPFAAVVDAAGTVAYVSNWGGRHAVAGERTATAGTYQGADEVVVDDRGIAATGSVTRVDLATLEVTQTIAVGLHPTAMVWDEVRQRLYVAAGNEDAVTVVDTRADTVTQTLRIAPFRDATPGLAPTALALAPDGATLYVALGGLNAIAVLDAASGAVRGLIPTAWYPASLDLSADGSTLAVGTMLGVGSGAVSAARAARSSLMVEGMGYVHQYRGAVNVIAVPTQAELGAYTVAVAANSGLALAHGDGDALLLPARPDAPPRAVPERPCEPSPIQHVVFIIKENRTYDQVFGDLPQGDGDPDLAIYGRAVTPNLHRLAESFVLLDNFYATGGNSGDGHQWVTQANETDYAMWGFTGRSYPYNGTDPIAPAWGGFLWDAAVEAGHSVRIFGEYGGPFRTPAGFPGRLENLAAWRDGADFAGKIHQVAPNHGVDALLDHEYPGYTPNVPDVVRAQLFRRRLDEWQAAGQMPDLVLVQLMNDHTIGTRPGNSRPAACVADNDLALGQIVDGLSHSPFWESMAIFVVEDDAQNGVDHVDGHRTVALAISPYARRGHVDHTWYAQQSMVKTIELMLGLRPLSVFDLIATPMTASFLGPEALPDLTPYTVAPPTQDLFEVNPPASSLYGPAREAAQLSARMDFSEVDAAPSDALNRILWHSAKGWDTPYPGVRTSLFFPMAVDLADEERELQGDGDEDDDRG